MYRFLAIPLVAIFLSACSVVPELMLSPAQDGNAEKPVSPTPDTVNQEDAAIDPDAQEILTLYRFDSAENAGRWAIVNDSVMGGVSESGLSLSEEGTLFFAGNLSLQNNGGFASVRSASDALGINDEAGIRLTVRGDGKRYHLRLYTPDLPGVAYEAAFQTAENDWQAIDLPFSTFKPTIRGRVLTGYGPIEPSAIEALGLMIKEYQVGAFLLEVSAIEAY